MARSERWRWLGPARYDVSGAQTWMLGRAYRGVVGYVEQVNPHSDPSNRTRCTKDCEVRHSIMFLVIMLFTCIDYILNARTPSGVFHYRKQGMLIKHID